MSSSIPSPSIVLEEISQLAPPGTPLTTPEIADEFDCTDRTIYNRLDTLVETGAIKTKKVGTRGRVWWRPLDKHGLNNTRGSEPKAIITTSTDSEGTRDQLREREEKLAAELDATKQLQEISTRLIQKDDTDALYDEILDAIVTIMNADFARLQLRDPDRGDLQLLTHHGFDKATALWDRVTPESNGPCSVSLETGQRVIVPDVETCEFMAGTEDQETYLNTGIRAIQSTPLVSRSGDVVGMLSTHWQTPHDPAERDLRSLDVLARQATDLINHQQVKEDLRRNQNLLAGQKRVLERLVRGASLDDVLTTLIHVIEEYTEGMHGSFLVSPPNEERFSMAIGPNLPQSYMEALQDVSFTPPYLGPCDKATHLGETVICDDTETDTRWASEWRELALSHKLRGCYSTPIIGPDDEVLGSFGLYSAQLGDVIPDQEVREAASNIAGIAIKRKQTEEALKQTNTGLEHLTTASRELMDASTQTITDRAAELTQTVLNVEYTALWRYDEITGEFSQHDHHTAPETGLDSIRFPAEFSKRVWQAFIHNETAVENDLPIPDLENERELGGERSSRAAPLPLQSYLLIPLGRHGVICAGSTHPGTFDEQTIDLTNTLAATLETAWNRAADEQQLARQNEELARLDRLNGLIREVSNALVQANSRAAIDRAVCDRLAASDQYAFVWIGEHDSVTETISPREWVGIDSSYIDDLATQLDDASVSAGRNPIATAAETRDIQVVSDIATETRFTPLREATLERGAHSCISVPLIYEESVYGVLSIYANHPRPDKRDHAVLAELGQMIAHAINAVETQETRHANRVVELTLQCQAPTTPLCRLAQQAGCDIEFEGFVHHPDGDPDIFFTASSVSPEKLVTASEQVRTIAELRCLTDQADTALFRARVSEPTLAARIVEQDGVVRTLTIEDETATAVVDVSHTATVREFIERLQHGVPSLKLLARQTRDRSLKTRSTFQSICEECLTAKQLAALQTAYFSGFFESPRTSTGQEVAASLNVSQPTFTAHLRTSEREVCNLLFAAEGTTAGL